ncbi:PDDEXK_3 family protein [Burkholderiales bacterium]|nr:PDDEXK_3 family protein [Burkholderiales bacterium]
MLLGEKLSERVIGLAIDVHREIGPGLLESVYERCLCHELGQVGIAFERQVAVPAFYKGERLDEGFRADIVVENAIILEIKAVAAILPAHEAQLQTYLRMSRIRIGLIMNFGASRLKDGLRRFVV